MGINYFRSGDSIEIIIKDPTGAKIEKHSCNVNDKKKYKSILTYLKDKYGFEPEVSAEESINNKEQDFDWWG
jgi:hypothetical protein